MSKTLNALVIAALAALAASARAEGTVRSRAEVVAELQAANTGPLIAFQDSLFRLGACQATRAVPAFRHADPSSLIAPKELS